MTFFKKKQNIKKNENFKVNNLATFPPKTVGIKCGQVIDPEVAKLLTLQFGTQKKQKSTFQNPQKTYFYSVLVQMRQKPKLIKKNNNFCTCKHNLLC